MNINEMKLDCLYKLTATDSYSQTIEWVVISLVAHCIINTSLRNEQHSYQMEDLLILENNSDTVLTPNWNFTNDLYVDIEKIGHRSDFPEYFL